MEEALDQLEKGQKAEPIVKPTKKRKTTETMSPASSVGAVPKLPGRQTSSSNLDVSMEVDHADLSQWKGHQVNAPATE